MKKNIALNLTDGAREKFYLTRSGLEKMKKDYVNLKNFRLQILRDESASFMESDDINPEYLIFQDDLSHLEAKLAKLEYIIKNCQLIEPPPKGKQGTVQLGAVVLIDIDGQKDEFEIVGTLEANPSLGKISDESPIGRALLGHKINEEIIISSPIKTHYAIKGITYKKT